MGQSYDPLQPSQVRCSCLMDGPSLAIWKLTIPLFQLGPLSPGGPTFSQAFNSYLLVVPSQSMRIEGERDEFQGLVD